MAARSNTLSADLPEPGMVLGRAYTIVEAIDGGPSGDCLRATDKRLDRAVLVTVMRAEHASSPIRERVLERAKARSRVINQNVASLYYFGEWNARPTIVSELVAGDDLPAFVAQHKGRLPLDIAFDIIEQTLRGLEALHAQGAPHGGLRPSSVRITPQMRVVVTELSVELPAEVNGQGTLMLAAPWYAAPELVDRAAQGELPEPTIAGDIFAVGVLAYSLLTGFLPTALALATSKQYRPPARPSELSSGFSAAMDEPLLRALAGDPATRFATAKQFREALANAQDDKNASVYKPRFLLVDDDPDYRAIATVCLEASFPDAVIVAASSGREALEYVERERFSLIMLDLALPDLNGIEVTAAIRGSERGRDVPIIVVTGRGGAAEWRVLSAMGAAAFVVKPIEPRGFVDQVRRFVAR